MPGKRYNRTLVGFLVQEEVEAILAVTDHNTWVGRRGRVPSGGVRGRYTDRWPPFPVC
jgi:hypothetical protein